MIDLNTLQVEVNSQHGTDKLLSMAGGPCFDMIRNHREKISALDGCVVECGVWRGGMSIFLARAFEEKDIWVVDSFEGFQDPKTGKYVVSFERHDHNNKDMKVSLDVVKANFALFGLNDDQRIHFLPGFVKDVLKPDTCSIEKIALLRIDVDAYSATREVLDYLYPKVVPGGYIIFDDSCLHETGRAIYDFAKESGVEIRLQDPSTDEVVPQISEGSGYHCCCYCVKDM